MASKLDLRGALSAAEEARTRDAGSEEEAAGTRTKPVSLRIRESDHNRFRALFAARGLSLSAGCVMAVTYVAEMIEAGVFTISKSGIHDTRERKV